LSCIRCIEACTATSGLSAPDYACSSCGGCCEECGVNFILREFPDHYSPDFLGVEFGLVDERNYTWACAAYCDSTSLCGNCGVLYRSIAWNKTLSVGFCDSVFHSASDQLDVSSRETEGDN